MYSIYQHIYTQYIAIYIHTVYILSVYILHIYTLLTQGQCQVKVLTFLDLLISIVIPSHGNKIKAYDFFSVAQKSK